MVALEFAAGPCSILSLLSRQTAHNARNRNCKSAFICSSGRIIPSKPSNSIQTTSSSSPPDPIRRAGLKSPSGSLSISLPVLDPIKPYLLSEWKPILKGWACSILSVYFLSKAVPTVGKFPAFNSNRWIREGLKLSALLLTRSAAIYWQQAFLWEAALNSAYRIRVYVFDRVLKRDLGFFEGNIEVSTGDVAYRITAEAADVADMIYAVLNAVVPNFLQASAMGIQLLTINPFLSMISALAIPSFSFVIAVLGEKLRMISRKAHLSIANLSAHLNEILPLMLVIKANNAEFCESIKFQRLAQDDLSKHLKKKRMKAFIPQIIQALYIGSLLILVSVSLATSRGSFDGYKMVSFVTSLLLLVEPVQGVGKAYNELKQGEPAIERLFDLTMFNSKVIEKPSAVDLESVTGDLKLCDITFRYGDDQPLILNKLNLHIKPGERIALVGPSGGGKSTVAKLLLRLYDPFSGWILLDDHDIQDIKLESLRQHIAFVSQDIMLFSGTVAENIGCRDLARNINMAQVQNAAIIANADEFIRTLPEGYDTNIGQRGSLLSGGQKQRLAIARALYQNPSILILDEATSALDSRSELLVRQAVARLMDKHTVLFIAHRLETVLMADRVVLLDSGKLQELDDLKSVISRGGPYGSLLSSGLII